MQELKAFAKTSLLAPGASEMLTLKFPIHRMASYDESRSAYVLEDGDYVIRVGEHSRATHVAAVVRVQGDAVLEQLAPIEPAEQNMTRRPDREVKPYTYEGEADEIAAAPVLVLQAIELAGHKIEYSEAPMELPAASRQEPWTMQEVRSGSCSLADLVAQLKPEELADICVGTARGGFGSDSIIGAASAVCPGAAGDTTSALLETRGVRNMILADGPAGLRLSTHFMVDAKDNIIPGSASGGMTLYDDVLGSPEPQELPKDARDRYQYCTAIPIATLLAQTWDVDALREAGDIVGEEMEELGVTLWLAPGMNIHRNPLCGRNFEYFAEDPLLAGMCAAADTLGVQRHRGVGTTIKHFACNNQEDNRMANNVHIGERALREIYLKGFEIAVKASQPMSVMTSYNLVNGVHTANHHGLLTQVLRDEWGFAGCVMTDWGTTREGATKRYACSKAAGCIKAGNDLIMPGTQRDVDDILAALEDSTLTLAELQACAMRVLSIAAQSSGYDDAMPYAAEHGGLDAFVRVAR